MDPSDFGLGLDSINEIDKGKKEENGYITEEIFLQIKEYYEFQNNLKNFFIEGINRYISGKNEKIYFVDSNWINKWKLYVNYDEVIKYIDKSFENIEKMKIKINYDYFPDIIYFSKSYEIFFKKTLLESKDLECLINEKTYKNIINYFSIIKLDILFINKGIEGYMYDKMIVFLINEFKRIKVIYKGDLETKTELIQLDFDFLSEDEINNKNSTNNGNNWNNYIFNNVNSIFNSIKKSINKLFKGYTYESFISQYITKNCNKFLNLINESGIGYMQTIEEKEPYLKISNNNLILKYYIIEQKQKLSQMLINNIDNPRVIGLENIGATCYMNATLQCLINIDPLTRYILNQNNFININNNAGKCEILSCYSFLLQKICCDENVKNYYSPKDFKNIISRKNPLFKGIKANDSKDLIYFLIEQMNFELNQIDQKIKNFVNYNHQNHNQNNFISQENMQSNENLMLSNFIQEFSYKNNNIIPKLFFSVIENETICNRCNTHKYNFQTNFSIEFPLEKIFNQIYGNQYNINNRKLSLIECFNNYNETNYFQGENSIHCNICKSQQNAIYKTQIFSLSPILVVILNRGKGNIFKCLVDFPEYLNVGQFVKSNKSNIIYKLIGVVSHLGSSDMSGHFIAFCRHRILKEWYCYNDAKVTRCNDQSNDFKKGESYILIYESTQGYNNILFEGNNFISNNINFQNNFMLMNNFINNFNLNNFNNNINNPNNMNMMNMNPNIINNMNNFNNMNNINMSNMNNINMNNMNNININNMNNCMNNINPMNNNNNVNTINNMNSNNNNNLNMNNMNN